MEIPRVSGRERRGFGIEKGREVFNPFLSTAEESERERGASVTTVRAKIGRREQEGERRRANWKVHLKWG